MSIYASDLLTISHGLDEIVQAHTEERIISRHALTYDYDSDMRDIDQIISDHMYILHIHWKSILTIIHIRNYCITADKL